MVQMTFEKVIKYSTSFQYGGTVKSWIFSIARNVLKEQWKKKLDNDSLDGITETVLDPALGGDDVLILKERRELISKAMQYLAPEKRELLSMIKLQEMSYKEAAKIYNVSPATLKVRVFRIITELKIYMKEMNAKEHY